MPLLSAALVAVALLNPHTSLASQGAPAHGPILTAVLAHRGVLQQRTPNPIQPSPVHASPKVRAALIGAFVGAVAGGAVGYFGTSDCKCDDPGYGIIYGVPIGGLVGAVAGAKLVK
jgi:hypothetical protein